jgi:hypothetical protein
MSVIEITPVEDIDGIDLSSTPPCECCWRGKLCQYLSAYRVFSACSGCGHQGAFFICQRCHDSMKIFNARCGGCGAIDRGIDRYI